MSEYTISSQEVRNNLNSRRLANCAWQVAGSFMLTREKNTYAGVKPSRAFEPNKRLRHLGGWELALRYSQLRIDPNTFPLFADGKHMPRKASEQAIGINWYLNRHAKFMTDSEHTSFEMSPGAFPLHSENLIMCRVQLVF